MIQYFFGRSNVVGNAFGLGTWTSWFNQSDYHGTGTAGSTYNAVSAVMATAGTLRNFRFKLSTAPGVGQSVVATIWKNGVATAISVSLGPGETEAEDLTNSVHFDVGDTTALLYVQSGAHYDTRTLHSIEFESDVSNECVYGVIKSNAGNGAFNGILSGSDWQAAVVHRVWNVISVPGNLERTQVVLAGSPGSGNSKIVTVVKNGIAQDGSGGTVDTRCTIAHPATSGSSTYSLPLVVGDYIYCKIDFTGGASAGDTGLGFKFVSNNDNDFMINGLETALPTVDLEGFYPPSMNNETIAQNPESANDVPGPATPIRLTGVVFQINAAPGIGPPIKTRTMQARKNGTTPAESPSVELSGTETLDIAGGDLALTIDDEWCARTLTSNSPAPADGNWSFVGRFEADVPVVQSGIYEIIKDKTNDTLWVDVNAGTTTDVKIP